MSIKNLILTAAIAVCAIPSVCAQEALNHKVLHHSPIINPDSTATIVINAPEAEKVEVFGLAPGALEMQRDSAGIWSLTTPPLSPNLYTYSIIVDGVRTADPSNVYLARDISSLSNILIIPGGNADLYAVQDVPHGNVSKVWYDSPALGMQRSSITLRRTTRS